MPIATAADLAGSTLLAALSRDELNAVETDGALVVTERMTHAAIGQRVGATR